MGLLSDLTTQQTQYQMHYAATPPSTVPETPNMGQVAPLDNTGLKAMPAPGQPQAQQQPGSNISPNAGSNSTSGSVDTGATYGAISPTSMGDADFQEPHGPAQATLREVPFGSGLVLKNQLTGELGEVVTKPLSKEQQQRAENHGAGSLNANDPNRQSTQVSDMNLSPGYDLMPGGGINVNSNTQQENAMLNNEGGPQNMQTGGAWNLYADMDLGQRVINNRQLEHVKSIKDRMDKKLKGKK